MKASSRFTLAVLACLMPLVAFADADTDAIKTKLQQNHPGLNVKNVQATPVSGLYEVFANGQLLYVSKNAEYVMLGGTLVEEATKHNLTADRLAELTSINIETLPFKDAIEIKKGNGKYKFAVFSDPDCPYCKSLEQGLEKLGLSDYTAYIFLFPLEELHKEAREKSETIWCAKDKSAAWHEWMVNGKLPEKANCENPIEQNQKLAEKLGVSGTPTIYLNDGRQTSSPQELVAAINKENQSK